MPQKYEVYMVADVSYRKTEAWQGFKPFITDLIDKNNIKRVCDIGGGANPLLDEEYIEKKGVDYSILDISETELFKAPPRYKKVLADIASPGFKIDEKYDLVFSRMLAEHVSDVEQFHRNILNCLADNGLAVHFFSTLYTLPFVVNYLTPEYFSSVLLNLFAPRDRYQHEKFPAYYRWCRGPTRRQIQKFISLGYDVVEYGGFFGHSWYYNKVKVLKKIHEFKTNYLLRHPNPYFTSYAYVVLKKKA
jgi:uncharacterized UPF0146 family protein